VIARFPAASKEPVWPFASASAIDSHDGHLALIEGVPVDSPGDLPKLPSRIQA
jgi:hypothetical protein